MRSFQNFFVGAWVVAGVVVAVPASAAPIAFVSGAGVAWNSDTDAVCGAPAACSGLTTTITRHGAWQSNNPDGSAAVWASYANTGITGTLAPINQPNNGQLFSLEYAMTTTVGSAIALKIWADDTAGIYMNGVQTFAPNITQSTCANGTIGCEPREFGQFAWVATGNDVLRIDVHQVGTGGTAASNPFGVLYYGSYDQREDSVPEPVTMALVGVGLLGAGMARRRLRR